MAKIEKIEKGVDEVNNLANLVAERANKDILLLKHKITCLTVLIALLFVLGASVSIYAIHSFKSLFYDMEVEETTIEQEAKSESGNAVNINGDSNKVGN